MTIDQVIARIEAMDAPYYVTEPIGRLETGVLYEGTIRDAVYVQSKVFTAEMFKERVLEALRAAAATEEDT